MGGSFTDIHCLILNCRSRRYTIWQSIICSLANIVTRKFGERVRMHYEEYMYLRDLEWEQNKRNEERDRRIDTKYEKEIAFMTKHGAGIALVMIGLMALVAAGIAWLILGMK